MPSLDSNSWSQSFKDALDRYITGNWGEDQFIGDEEEEPMRLVYIRFEPGANVWHIHDARTQDQLDHECGSFGTNHDAIEYASSMDWDVRDGPVAAEDEDDRSDEADVYDDPYDIDHGPDFEGYPGTGGFTRHE